jgi:MFS family permease
MAGNEFLLYLGATLIGFNFGGNFALFPALTADYFGNKNLGNNYGWMFTAYGIAGILGPQLAGLFKDSAKGSGDPVVWMTPFIVAGVGCLVGSIIMKMTNPPKLEESTTQKEVKHKLQVKHA